MKIGILGAKGSFSEQAGETYAVENALSEYVIAPLVTAEALLAAHK